MSVYFQSIPLSAEHCCDCRPPPAGFATWCYPAGAGAAGMPASSPTPAGISLGLWGCCSVQHSGHVNYQKQNNTKFNRWRITDRVCVDSLCGQDAGAESSKWDSRSTKVGGEAGFCGHIAHWPGKVFLQLLLSLQHCLFLRTQYCTFTLQVALVFLVGLEEFLSFSPEGGTFTLQAAPFLLMLIHKVLFVRSEDRAFLLKAIALHLHRLQFTSCEEKKKQCFI